MKSRRIAYLLKKFPRLSETFVLDEILGQERLGRDVFVFSRRPPDDEPRHPQLTTLRAPVEVLPPKDELDPWRLLFASGSDPARAFARVGRLVGASRAWNHPRFSMLLGEALHLLERTRELGIEHVHTHFATDSAMVAMILSELGGPSYSITAHAKDIYRSTVDERFLSRLFARAEFVVTVCDANVRYLEGRVDDAARARLRRLYNGVDLERFAPPTVPREADHVLSVGRLVEKKGFHVLIGAVARLRDAGRRVTCTIVGEGDQRPRLEGLVRERGLEDVVRFAGARDQEQVRALLRRATCLCLPCVVGTDGNRDALPTVLLEALACGLPAVSTPVTGIPEILDGGRAGLLVPEEDERATAGTLDGLLSDSALRDRLARRGRRRAEELFDARAIAATLRRWIDDVPTREEEPCASPA